MALVLNCLFCDGFVTIALYIQAYETDAIKISRLIIEKTLLGAYILHKKLCCY